MPCIMNGRFITFDGTVPASAVVNAGRIIWLLFSGRVERLAFEAALERTERSAMADFSSGVLE